MFDIPPVSQCFCFVFRSTIICCWPFSNLYFYLNFSFTIACLLNSNIPFSPSPSYLSMNSFKSITGWETVYNTQYVVRLGKTLTLRTFKLHYDQSLRSFLNSKIFNPISIRVYPTMLARLKSNASVSHLIVDDFDSMQCSIPFSFYIVYRSLFP